MRISRLPLFVSLLIAFAAPTAGRCAPCGNGDEAEADAALRYQARLRVIALTCSGNVAGHSLYNDYQSFIARNQDLLAQYRARLLNAYKGHGRGDPASRLNAHDTEVNNEEMVEAAGAPGGMAGFCRAHRDDLVGASTAAQAVTRENIKALQQAEVGKCR